MPHSYTEDQQAPRTLTQPLPVGEELEQPAKASGPPSPWPFSHWEKGGRQAGLRVRSLVLVSRLRVALERLNPALPPGVTTGAVNELTRDRSAKSRFLRQMNLKTN
jgi:hypothetical protein